MANTDERLKAILESKAFYCDCKKVQDVDFAAQKALEARDALRRIRDVCNPETPFTRAVSKPVLKAMAELIDKVLAD